MLKGLKQDPDLIKKVRNCMDSDLSMQKGLKQDPDLIKKVRNWIRF